MTRTWFRFFSAWQYCMQVNICLTARLYSLCRYGGLVVSAVLVCTEHEGSNPGKDQPAPTTLRRHRAGMPPVASGQTGTASLAVQRPTDCTTVAPVAHRIPVLRWLVTLEELLPLYAHSHASMRSAVRLRPQRGSKASLEASIACSPSSKRRVPQNPVGRTGRGADGHAAMAWVHAR